MVIARPVNYAGQSNLSFGDPCLVLWGHLCAIHGFAFYSWMINFLDPFTSQNCNFLRLSTASA